MIKKGYIKINEKPAFFQKKGEIIQFDFREVFPKISRFDSERYCRTDHDILITKEKGILSLDDKSLERLISDDPLIYYNLVNSLAKICPDTSLFLEHFSEKNVIAFQKFRDASLEHFLNNGYFDNGSVVIKNLYNNLDISKESFNTNFFLELRKDLSNDVFYNEVVYATVFNQGLIDSYDVFSYFPSVFF